MRAILLPAYMVPGHFVFLEGFPATANGKLDRNAPLPLATRVDEKDGGLSVVVDKLGILGAGPKAVAIAAKARALKHLGFTVPQLVIYEKTRVAEHWRPASWFTSGDLPLGTPPARSLGSRIFG